MSAEKDRMVWDLGSLGIDENNVAEIPTGGVDFGAGSFIAPWMVNIVYTFATTEDPELHQSMASEADQITMPPYPVRVADPYYWMTYDDKAMAIEAQGKLDPSPNKIKPSANWRISCNASEVLNSSDTGKLADSFGDVMVFNVPIKSLAASEKYRAKSRHMYQFFVLPFAVQSAALAFGLLDQPLYHADELTIEGAQTDLSDEQFFALVGDTKSGDIWESTMGKRRSALWLALGEENAKAYTPIGTKTPNGKRDATTNTTSDNLSRCVKLVSARWSIPLYARVLLVPDPRPDALTNSGGRLSIAVIEELFGPGDQGLTMAKAAADQELEERGKEAGPGHPGLPENWQDAGLEAWLEELSKHGKDKPASVVMAAAYADSEEQIKAWWQYMDENQLWQ